jgi:membrane-bound inhibitor of C-type lysozyme
MITLRNLVRGLAPAMLAAIVLQACTAEPPAGGEAEATVGESSAPEGMEPGTSLAFEWSANGFEQVASQYEWSGSGKRDDVFQPNLSLSVPETDDAIWSSSCEAGGKVETQLYLAPPKGMKGNRATFRFETDQSAQTRSYQVRYVADGQYDGFALVQSASDPMFADMKAGRWAYIQIGEGSDATKLRIALTDAKKAMEAFLPACPAARPAAPPQAASLTQSYSCEDGRMIRATYVDNDSDTPSVRLAVGERALELPQAPSGSGAQYLAEVAGQTFQWLTKADQGTLIVAQSDGPGSAKEQITNCTAI